MCDLSVLAKVAYTVLQAGNTHNANNIYTMFNRLVMMNNTQGRGGGWTYSTN